jgi:hypothetical protein
MIDGAFRLLRRTWAPSMVVVLVLVGPFDLLSGLVQDVLGFTDLMGADLSVFDPNATAEPLEPFTNEDWQTVLTTVAVLLVLAIATGLMSAIANGAVTRLAVVADEGREPTWTEGVSHAFRRAWPLIGSAVLVGLAFLALAAVAALIIVGLVAAIGPAGFVIGLLVLLGMLVPAALLFGVFFLTVPVIVLEDAGPIAALRRSVELVRRQVWRVVGIALLATIALNLAVASIGFAGSIAVLAAGPVAGLVAGLLSVLQRLLILPVSAYLALLLYVDARTRREGLDIEARIAQLPPPMAP